MSNHPKISYNEHYCFRVHFLKCKCKLLLRWEILGANTKGDLPLYLPRGSRVAWFPVLWQRIWHTVHSAFDHRLQKHQQTHKSSNSFRLSKIVFLQYSFWALFVPRRGFNIASGVLFGGLGVARMRHCGWLGRALVCGASGRWWGGPRFPGIGFYGVPGKTMFSNNTKFKENVKFWKTIESPR